VTLSCNNSEFQEYSTINRMLFLIIWYGIYIYIFNITREVQGYFKISLNFYKTTNSHTLYIGNINNRCHENRPSHNVKRHLHFSLPRFLMSTLYSLKRNLLAMRISYGRTIHIAGGGTDDYNALHSIVQFTVLCHAECNTNHGAMSRGVLCRSRRNVTRSVIQIAALCHAECYTDHGAMSRGVLYAEVYELLK
jgi:hypothetical protein